MCKRVVDYSAIFSFRCKIKKRMKFLSGKRTDVVVLIAWIFVSAAICFLMQAKGLVAIVVYLVIPAGYLCLRERKNYKKLFAATLIFGIPAVGIFDFILEVNHAWMSDPSKLVFPQKIFGLTPVDYAVFYFAWIFFSFAFYEHFLDDEKRQSISKYAIYAIAPFAIGLALTLVLLAFAPHLLLIPYTYLIGGAFAAVPPLAYIVYWKPKLLSKVTKLGLFFFVLALMIEVTSLQYGLWRFPGEYIGLVSMFGVTFPFEEFVFWICLCAPAVVAWYEFSIDDGK